MIHTGLVSITFRKLTPQEIINLVAKAGLEGIEWGGDIHVPHGNLKLAGEVGRMTADAGLQVASYGSYYHVGCEEQEGIAFEKVLDTALELKAPTIRVWAGNRGSREADEGWWKKVVDETCRIAGLAKGSGISVSFEYHGNTLTDTGMSASKLMRSAAADNVASYWQPSVGLGLEEQLEGLKQVMPWLGNVHAFWWNMHERRPLAEGAGVWKKYMDAIRTVEGDRYCMTEFVMGDDPAQFLKDAEVLKQIVDS